MIKLVEFVFDGEEKIVGKENMKDLAEMMVIAAESEEKPMRKKKMLVTSISSFSHKGLQMFINSWDWVLNG